ncbi:hypothetical protein [Aneurinibacillus tyrosinisolvens]|nr:hypothetical protein [Aneurinibacillus tyrosinisolvens]
MPKTKRRSRTLMISTAVVVLVGLLILLFEFRGIAFQNFFLGR